MGLCHSSRHKFDKLAYPSYCTLEPATHDDRLLCLETWHEAVRTRRCDDPFIKGHKKSFDALQRVFIDALTQQHVPNTEQFIRQDFLVQLVSALAHGRSRAHDFRAMALGAATWSAIGTALIIAVRHAYQPKVWTDEMQGAWIRTLGDLLREVFKL